MIGPWTFIFPGAFAVGVLIALSSCTNPYDPGDRTIGGAAGAGSGAASAPIGGTLRGTGGVATSPPSPAIPHRYRYAPPAPGNTSLVADAARHDIGCAVIMTAEAVGFQGIARPKSSSRRL